MSDLRHDCIDRMPRAAWLCAPLLFAAFWAGPVTAGGAPEPAPAAQPAGASTPQPSELRVVGAKDEPVDIDKVVCKTVVNSGSRIQSTKVCMSQRQASANGRMTAKRIDENATVVSLTD